jgi:hypothetical protein
MKSKRLTIALAVLAFVLPIQGQKPSTPQSDQGRYQLLAVPLDDPYPASIGSANSRKTPSQQLFLFDSQTGRVWHYQPENFQGTLKDFADHNPTAGMVPQAFVPVPFWPPGPKDKVTPDGN